MQNCAPAFNACSGLNSALNAINGDACNNADDLAKGVANQDQIKPIVQQCAQSCILASDMSSCASQCIQKAGISAACSDCFGADVECTKDNCALSCIDPNSQTCVDCSMKYCGPAFDSCSGLNSTVRAIARVMEAISQMLRNGANGDACNNAADLAKGVANKDQIQPVVQSCAQFCILASDMASCTSQCVQKSGISAACSDCLGTDAACTKDNCALQCLDPNSQTCLDCSKQNCAPAFDACSGLNTQTTILLF
jgi:hypothetical protein